MIFKNKIAVFDLDGTLWEVNSHYEILNMFYNTKFWTSFVYKCLCKALPSVGRSIRDLYYERISIDFISSVEFPFNVGIIALLEKKREEGFYIEIVSNAPSEIIIKNAAKRLHCDYLKSDIGNKWSTLKNKFDFRELFVCTDNISDLDLVQKADTYFIIPRKYVKRFYKKRGYIV